MKAAHSDKTEYSDEEIRRFAEAVLGEFLREEVESFENIFVGIMMRSDQHIQDLEWKARGVFSAACQRFAKEFMVDGKHSSGWLDPDNREFESRIYDVKDLKRTVMRFAGEEMKTMVIAQMPVRDVTKQTGRSGLS